MGRGKILIAALCLVAVGCADDDDGRGNEGGLDGYDSSGGDDGGGPDKLDSLGDGDGVNPCNEGGDCPECVEVEHTPCDDGTSDLFEAIGLNCPDEAQVTGTVAGHADGMAVLTSFGTTAQWDPREGSAMAVIGSGYIGELMTETPAGDDVACPTHCNDDFDQTLLDCADFAKNDINMYDPGTSLPTPVMTNNVSGDCGMNPALLGTGDCSNTIQGQFSQGVNAHDYTEMRVVASVPPDNNSFSYDFAFFSTEYPYYYNSQFNDMYVAWLESEAWTGNVSFDEMGNPISLNAGFLDFKDDAGTLPEFAGTCMKQHAGTKWLSSTAPVKGGEEITVVFAVFDLSDSILDSYTLIDNWRWGCDGNDTPETNPVG